MSSELFLLSQATQYVHVKQWIVLASPERFLTGFPIENFVRESSCYGLFPLP